jgi:hypothetical protein
MKVLKVYFSLFGRTEFGLLGQRLYYLTTTLSLFGSSSTKSCWNNNLKYSMMSFSLSLAAVIPSDNAAVNVTKLIPWSLTFSKSITGELIKKISRLLL